MSLGTFETEFNNSVNKIKVGTICGSYNVAEYMLGVLKNLVVKEKWQTAKQLLTITTKYGHSFAEKLPLETSAINMFLRLMKIIKEEHVTTLNAPDDTDQQDSLHKILTSEDTNDDFSKIVPNLKEAIEDQLCELQMELETCSENIAREGVKHIHTNEIILTIGKSNIVEAFLKNAAKKRTFEVIICECSPLNQGHDMALSLSKKNIQTTLISDSSCFGVMSRVNKVIIGTQAVMANGGLRAVCGTHAVALAAKFYSVPVIVLAGMYKLSPTYVSSIDQDKFNEFLSPASVISYCQGQITSRTRIINPVFDFVPPELITLFISNIGSHAPSYMYRLLSELYHPDNTNL